MSFVSEVQDSPILQGLIAAICMIPFILQGTVRYFRTHPKENGLKVGVFAIGTALLFDFFITVPFFEIPNGGSYRSFFLSPVLWGLVLLNFAIIYLYWYLKIRKFS